MRKANGRVQPDAGMAQALEGEIGKGLEVDGARRRGRSGRPSAP